MTPGHLSVQRRRRELDNERRVGGPTSRGPTLTPGSDGRLYLGWKGEGDDKGIFVSSSADSENWTPEKLVGDSRLFQADTMVDEAELHASLCWPHTQRG